MNTRQKQFIISYIAIILIAGMLLAWGQVSWLFNYRQVSSLVYDFFHPYEESPLLAGALTQPQPGVALANNIDTDAATYPYVTKENSIEIAKIAIEAPLVMSTTTDVRALTRDLDKGVVFYPGSVKPGQPGHISVLGHSAPPNWPHIKYDWVFSNIEKLEENDAIVVNYDNRQFTYKVKRKAIIMPGQEIPTNGLDSNANILTLISCWPPGKNYKRIIVQAELVKMQ